jgi:L-malate glycosyltransferase
MAAITESRRLLHVFSTFAVGGPQIRFCTLANALGNSFQHVIIAMDDNFECAVRLGPEVGWQKLPIPVAKSRGLAVANLRRFRRILNDAQPDFLLTYNWGSIEWALVNRWLPCAPHIHFEDGFGPDENPTAQLWRRVYMRRIALSGASRVIVPSRALSELASKKWGLSQRRTLLIRNGVDTDRFDRAPNRAALSRLGIHTDGVVIGTVTVMRPEKNLRRLIAAFRRLGADFRGILVLVGDGSERKALEAFATQSGVGSRIYFLGSVEHPEEIFGCFDIFAMSSDTEQMPLALLEAMASGLPVAATDVGDISDMVAPENRPFIEGCWTEESLAKGLEILASDPVLRTELGDRNRARARNQFSQAAMIQRYRELFVQL